ncbi:Do family serine endopeptidase [Methylotenera versatilis]|uniref:Do family serine endopeptidase n=1 Tax=Methylotenera versatilis TaxID=1055487 RepID=UPI000647C4D8|nr:Do family serine endopeptidase [Methylotenera versatilis]
MQRIWLIFAQSVTACLGILFVLRLFYPQLLITTQEPITIKQVGSNLKASTVSPQTSSKGSYSDAAKKAMPAVVNIFTSSQKTAVNPQQQYKDDPLFRHFFGDQLDNEDEQPDSSLGSGVIVSEQGLILTNDHVVASADEIEILLSDGRKLPAKVVGTDPETDLAVIKVEADKLPSITFAATDKLDVGDVVLAIGNPFGVGQTVTQGIVSALGRNHLGINTFENFIQTDASINPGNSGGALIDTEGNLVGINSAIYSRSGGSMGIGFAIPASLAKQVMEQIALSGSVTRGWIGIEAQDITPELAESFKLDKVQGSLIAGVLRDSPADLAGIRSGDVLLAINNREVTDSNSMLNIIAVLKPNEKAVLTLARNQKNIKVEVVIGKRPKPIAMRRQN